MARTLSIRSRLVGILFLVIVVFGGAVFGLSIYGSRSAVRTLSRELIARQVDDVAERLDSYLSPVGGALDIGKSWGAEGLLDPDRPLEMRPLLQPLLNRFPQMSAALVADDRGREFMLIRSEGKWLTRETRRDEWGSRVRWTDWTDEKPKEEWKETDYDPRTRPWFKGAMASRGADHVVHWTEPYKFFTTGQPGITAAAAFRSGDRDRVLGFDVALEDISKFTMSLGFVDHCTIFVVTLGDLAVGLPKQMGGRTPDARRAAFLRPVTDLGIPVLRDALMHVPEAEGEAARFESGGEAWWGGRRRYGRHLVITVAVPEREILGDLAGLRAWLLALTVLVLLFALWRAAALARRFARPIEQLVEESDRLSRGDLEPGPPVASPVTELRRLADAQERLRVSLRKLLQLEGELRVARRIQQETFPRRLPALKGFDCAGFTLPAAETGGDTYDAVGIAADGALTGEGAVRALFLVADATGHGLGPALSVTQVRAMLRMAVRTGRGIAEIVRHLNEQLHEDLESGRFVTAWFGELDAKRGTLVSFSAGQGPLLRYDAAGATWEERNSDLPPLGIAAKLNVKVPASFEMRTGDMFLVLSDGFYEAASPEGELFGTERVKALVEAHREEPAARVLEKLREAIDAHLAGASAADDRTALLLKRL